MCGKVPLLRDCADWEGIKKNLSQRKFDSWQNYYPLKNYGRFIYNALQRTKRENKWRFYFITTDKIICLSFKQIFTTWISGFEQLNFKLEW